MLVVLVEHNIKNFGDWKTNEFGFGLRKNYNGQIA